MHITLGPVIDGWRMGAAIHEHDGRACVHVAGVADDRTLACADCGARFSRLADPRWVVTCGCWARLDRVAFDVVSLPERARV